MCGRCFTEGANKSKHHNKQKANVPKSNLFNVMRLIFFLLSLGEEYLPTGEGNSVAPGRSDLWGDSKHVKTKDHGSDSRRTSGGVCEGRKNKRRLYSVFLFGFPASD